MAQTETAWRGKAEKAYEQLRADIETGKLAPGQTVTEHELVAYTGASRTPVREAIRRLAAEGLIDLEPRRAPTVSRISIRSARSLFDFRRLLEPAAIRMVAVKARESASLRDVLLGLLDQFCALRGVEYSTQFSDQFLIATSKFDDLLIAHTPNEYLSRSIADLRPHSARLRHIAHSDRTRLQGAIEEHIRMCAAVVDGDADEAAQAMVEHLDLVDRAIFRNLLKGGDADVLVS